MGLSADKEGWKEQRRQLRRELPWLADEVFDLRSKEAFKDNYARAVCCAIPTFDLVIVDEGHNLKHGFHEGVAARNRMLALAMGRDVEADPRVVSRLWSPGQARTVSVRHADRGIVPAALEPVGCVRYRWAVHGAKETRCDG